MWTAETQQIRELRILSPQFVPAIRVTYTVPAIPYAQEQLCRKLMGLSAKIPGGKWLRIEVGDSPL